ncbi:uncharacterized protein K02A2.6 [Octopus bimaculoides]|nr:uncharacterized protein K02A2.6 [Octopus bimaculoides]|eukprot:XP_014780676.1 PREDICTED: uncharacterized protein K02A2.6-like [Octopus bimaculoides]
MDLCCRCTSCCEHRKASPKPAIHPWTMPEKPWSRLHVNHAINFMEHNWLVVTDAYTKYPCIHATTFVSSKTTMDLLEEDFAHFDYPHTIVSDNATCLLLKNFKTTGRREALFI